MTDAPAFADCFTTADTGRPVAHADRLQAALRATGRFGRVAVEPGGDNRPTLRAMLTDNRVGTAHHVATCSLALFLRSEGLRANVKGHGFAAWVEVTR